MKSLVCIGLFLSQFAWGQFFESDFEEEEQTTSGFFATEQDWEPIPDQEENLGPGDPAEPAPINQHLFLLPLLGLGIGYYGFARRKSISKI